MLRLVAIVALVLGSVPAYSAGGGEPVEKPKCKNGQVYNEKTKKCEDPQRGPDLNDKSAYGLIPPGFYGFCKTHPDECRPVEPDILTSDWMPTLERVNREINAVIAYKPEGLWDDDVWTISPKDGDCDDYTVTKRQKLVEAGVPRGAMRAAYVLPADNKDHVFLVVSTTAGDFVLDNQTDEVYSLDRAMLLRLSIQDAADPMKWWQVY
jgi:predicted transglutaminase-like cysteine proteinase